MINVAVSVNLKIPEFLCALSELFARWDPWPFSIAPGALPSPPLSHGAELLCDPSSVLSFRALTSSVQTIPAPSPFPPHHLLSGRGVNCAAARSSGRENSTRQDWTGQSRTAFMRLKKTQPNPKPGPQPTFRIRKVLSHFPVSIWLELSLADAWEAGAPLLLNCFLFWRIIRTFT